MNITKYSHSCLLVEENGKTFLIDPGIYSAEFISLDALPQLDYLLITHEHPDHFHLPLVKQVVERFPDVRILTNESIVEQLKTEGIAAAAKGDESVEIGQAPHERIFMHPKAPPNIAFHISGKLTHPGDSLSFSVSREILALPVQAPWGSTTWAVEKAQELGPRMVLPIHDWHWKDEARSWAYENMRTHFEKHGIRFLALHPGDAILV